MQEQQISYSHLYDQFLMNNILETNIQELAVLIRIHEIQQACASEFYPYENEDSDFRVIIRYKKDIREDIIKILPEGHEGYKIEVSAETFGGYAFEFRCSYPRYSFFRLMINFSKSEPFEHYTIVLNFEKDMTFLEGIAPPMGVSGNYFMDEYYPKLAILFGNSPETRLKTFQTI